MRKVTDMECDKSVYETSHTKSQGAFRASEHS